MINIVVHRVEVQLLTMFFCAVTIFLELSNLVLCLPSINTSEIVQRYKSILKTLQRGEDYDKGIPQAWN